jgi:hypothetical protein
MRTLSFLLLGLAALTLRAQEASRPLVQFSGVVVTGDSLQPVPFVSILIKGTYRGTISDVYGYFSFVAQEGDTLNFGAMGFKRGEFVVPDSLVDRKYSMIHVLYPDTFALPPVDVYPWPSREQFAEAFMNLHLTEDDYQRALKQMSNAEVIQRMENMPPDAALNYQYAMAMNNTKLYNQGGYPSINLFNPIAWAQFVQAWKSGKFKKKKP